MTTKAKSEARDWVENLARFGYAAKGVVYIAVGVLAAQAAFSAGATPSKQSAIQSLLSAPFGRVLLAVVAIGLVAYGVWRIVQAALDTENEGNDGEGMVKRVGYAISGVVYLGLAFVSTAGVFGFSLGLGGGGGSGGSSGGGSGAQSAAQGLMSQPFGRFLVGAVGIIIIAVGLYQFKRAYDASFTEKLKRSPQWLERLGRAGFAARGVVYLLIGGFFTIAAWQADASEAGGMQQALTTLENQPYGPWLLGLVALGLGAYGIYAICLARYRRVSVS